MKKVKKIIFLLSFFFVMTGVVFAKESIFEREWRDNESFNLDYYQSSPVLNLQYQNGYVTIYSLETTDDNNEIYVRYYDSNGNIIKNSKVSNFSNSLKIRLIDAVTSDDCVFLLVYTINSSNYSYKYQIMKLDNNFNVDKTIDIYNDEVYGCDGFDCSKKFRISQVSGVAPHYGMSTLSIADNRLYILGEYFNIISLDLELNSRRDETNRETLVKKYFPGFYQLAKLSVEEYRKFYTEEDYKEFHYRESSSYYEELIRRADDNYYITADSESDYTAFSSIPDGCSSSSYYWLYLFYPQWEESISGSELDEISNGDYGIASISCEMPTPSIGLLKENDIVWTVESKDYEFFPIVKLVGDYVVALGVGYEGIDIVVYDLDGELVQTIKVNDSTEDGNNIFNYLNSTSTGFLVSDVHESTECTDDYEGCQITSVTEHYSILYNITINVEGEGEVKANEQSYKE